jgi:hypothetical protein
VAIATESPLVARARHRLTERRQRSPRRRRWPTHIQLRRRTESPWVRPFPSDAPPASRDDARPFGQPMSTGPRVAIGPGRASSSLLAGIGLAAAVGYSGDSVPRGFPPRSLRDRGRVARSATPASPGQLAARQPSNMRTAPSPSPMDTANILATPEQRPERPDGQALTARGKLRARAPCAAKSAAAGSGSSIGAGRTAATARSSNAAPPTLRAGRPAWSPGLGRPPGPPACRDEHVAQGRRMSALHVGLLGADRSLHGERDELFVGAKSALRVGLARGTGVRHEKGEDAGDRGRASCAVVGDRRVAAIERSVPSALAAMPGFQLSRSATAGGCRGLAPHGCRCPKLQKKINH